MTINESSPPVTLPHWEDEAFTAAGWGVGWTWMSWAPDRDLNPQYAHLPDEPHYAIFYVHPRPDTGEACAGSATIDSPTSRENAGNQPRWELVSADPLHLEPSLLCKTCRHHGFFRRGRWEPA